MKKDLLTVIPSVVLLASLVAAPAIAAQECSVKASISPANQIAPGVPETTNGTPTQITLNGQPSVKGNALISLHWEQQAGPSVTLSDPDIAKPTFLVPSVGPGGATLTFKLTVSGCSPVQVETAYTNILVTNVNSPPAASFTISPSVVAEKTSVTLDGSLSSDPESDPLTYLWTQTSGPAVELDNTSASIAHFIAPVVPYPDGASLNFKLTVSDGFLSNSIEKTVTVKWYNDEPVVDLKCPATVNEKEQVTLDGSQSSDTDGDGIASYQWLQLFGLPNADLSQSVATDATLKFEAPQLTTPQYNTMTFELTVTDNGGLHDSKTCDVKVLDITPPVISAHDNVTASAYDAGGAVVTYTSPDTTDAVDGPGIATCLPASNTVFALGDTTVTCHATDVAGNPAIPTTFKVTVQDTTPPVIGAYSGPAPVEAIGPSGAPVHYPTPPASDNVDAIITATCTPASDTTFALGDTTVTCNATDAAGNHAIPTTFNVTVQDTTPPVIGPYGNPAAVEATGPSGAVVVFTNPGTIDTVDGPGKTICAPASGSTFGLGETKVTCTASDAHGNAAIPAVITVTVTDKTPPVLSGVPANITAIAASASGAPVTFTYPTAWDLVDGAVAVKCLPAGGTFVLGTTPVACSATDGHGNTATAGFNVTVNYGFSGLLSPYDPGKAYKVRSAIPIKWQFTSNGGAALPSAGASPSVEIYKISNGVDATDAITLADAGSSGYQYDGTTNTWQYNWKTTLLDAGTYDVYVVCGATGQKSAPYKVQLTR